MAYCDKCGYNCDCDILEWEESRGMHDADEVDLSVCGLCQQTENYPGHCACDLVADADPSFISEIDRIVLSELGLGVRVVFGAPATDEDIWDAYLASPANSELAWAIAVDLLTRTGLGAEELDRVALSADRPAFKPDGERGGLEVAIQDARRRLDQCRSWPAMREIAASLEYCTGVGVEDTLRLRRESGIEMLDSAPRTTPPTYDWAVEERGRQNGGRTTRDWLEERFGTPAGPHELGERHGHGHAKGPVPTEPYDDGYCWFYAIDPEGIERMWDEVECAAYASLREINQLGREYGYSRRRLIIRKVADGKYHMEPDLGGVSGTARTFQAWMDEIYSPNGMHSRAKTGLFGMPYTNFEGKMRTASLGAWVEVQLMLGVVNACLGRDFSKVTERKAAADDYRKMDRTCPFTHFDRFPSHVQYVWMDGGDWPNKEMQLFAALSYQESSVEDNRGGGPGGQQGAAQRGQQVSNSFGYNDAATAYYNALRNMKNQVVSLSGVYDRDSVERQFRSFWTADKIIDMKEEVNQVLQPGQLLVDEHAPGSWTWSARNRYVELSDVNDNTTLPASGIVVMFSTVRTANHRARVVVQRDAHGGLNAITFDMVATAD